MPALKDYYTAELLKAGEKGRVRVKVCLDTAGQITSTELLDSSGFERLDQAAVKFIQGFRFKPGTANGVAQAGCIGVPVAFVPDEVPAPQPSAATPPPANPSVVVSAPSIDDFYPQDAIQRGEQGSVRVKICYDAKGRVNTTDIVQSAGYAALDEAALSMAKGYTFKSGRKGEALQANCLIAPIGFRLRR